jgi:hypothetical protein
LAQYNLTEKEKTKKSKKKEIIKGKRNSHQKKESAKNGKIYLS